MIYGVPCTLLILACSALIQSVCYNFYRTEYLYTHKRLILFMLECGFSFRAYVNISQDVAFDLSLFSLLFLLSTSFASFAYTILILFLFIYLSIYLCFFLISRFVCVHVCECVCASRLWIPLFTLPYKEKHTNLIKRFNENWKFFVWFY